MMPYSVMDKQQRFGKVCRCSFYTDDGCQSPPKLPSSCLNTPEERDLKFNYALRARPTNTKSMCLLLWIVHCWVVTLYLLHNVFKVKVKVKLQQSVYRPGQALSVPGGWGFQIWKKNRHMKVVRLLALRTGRLYPPGNIPGNNFCLALTTHSQLGPRLKKEYSYTATPPPGLHGLFYDELHL